MSSPHVHDPVEDHDDFGGLQRDLPNLVGRRRLLGLIGGASLAGIAAACGGTDSDSVSADTSTSTSATSTSTTMVAGPGQPPGGAPPPGVPGDTSGGSDDGSIPQETAGPYPADGTNGPNVLDDSGVARRDITSSIGEYSGTVEGVPTAIQLTLVDKDSGDPLADKAVYLWHCDRDGNYSIYDITDQNYLRGVQTSDADGVVTFDSIFPGCYNGRWPHVHFEVYDDPASVSSGTEASKTSQLAIPEEGCNQAYAADGYSTSASNQSRQSLSTDNVFSDGWDQQLATVSGSVSKGFTLALDVEL